jgi:RecA-family ATPase
MPIPADAIKIAKGVAAEWRLAKALNDAPSYDEVPPHTEIPPSADGDPIFEPLNGASKATTPEPDNTPAGQNAGRKLPSAPTSWWRDPSEIPPRQSLYEGHYIRRAIGATVGAGGRAKTTMGIYEATSMAVGRDLATREALPAGELRIWVCNGEEDQDELDRRVAAVCQHYGVSKADLGGRLFVQSVRDNPLRIATLVSNRPVIDTAVMQYVEQFIRQHAIDVFMLDPLVSFHGVVENDNGQMDVVIKEGFGAIANRTNSAGELFHHPGKAKPGQADTTVEDGRGASSILWAVRSARSSTS